MAPASNQLATRILLIATTTTQRPGETPTATAITRDSRQGRSCHN